MKSEKTTIQISVETRERLMAIGRKGESYNYLIEKLLDRFVALSEENKDG